MNKKLRRFFFLDFLILAGFWLILLFKGMDTCWLFLFFFIILGFLVYSYYSFYSDYQEKKEWIRKVLEEKKWDEILQDPRNDNDLVDLLRLFIKGYSKQVQREHTTQIMDKQVQISTLQSQINPHFLYNTMESIRGQALSEGSIEIAQMGEALSAFFRYSIDQKGNFVTLQDEINNIQNYLFIQSYRFHDKFTSQIHIDDDDSSIYDYILPKLTIQPVVENAIYHGLETKSNKGSVNINVTSTKNRLLITISDDGIGMNQETLDRLNNKLQDRVEYVQEKFNSSGTGLALINVNRRIKLVFGKDYGIYVYSTLNKGTDVEIVLPLIKEKKHLLDMI